MRNALIITAEDFIPCSPQCESLVVQLKQCPLFEQVYEISSGASTAVIETAPDLIISRFHLNHWATGFQRRRTVSRSAKMLAVLCQPQSLPDASLPAVLLEVDDFLFCNSEESELIFRLTRLLKAQARRGIWRARHEEKVQERDFLVGRSEAFLTTLRKVELLAQSKASVVISGETGCGKELLARAIHYQSARHSKPFIPVNCGALPDELFENELFGHVKGAYTHAISAEKGLIAEAEGGTLFLDEVDALSPPAQIKLLRFLQSGEYRPLGLGRSLLADVRVIAATNCDLAARVEARDFREDLHYRLNVLSLTIPPLRDRGDDVIELAQHFLAVYAQEHGRITPSLSASAMNELRQYSWPGNVRELEGVIQRAIVLRHSELLTAEDLEVPAHHQANAPELKLFRARKSFAIGQFERDYIVQLLTTYGGNISRAAKAAGKDRRSFQRLVSKYALDRKSFQTP